MIKVEKISIEHLVIQGEGNIVSDMGGEKVMLNIENGKYYNLGKIGGEIWGIIDKPILVSELINDIMTKYDVNREKCEEEVISFLESMYKECLVKVINNN
ncbi:lasso peptide biosynthesis PqqD family chaperone [Priestia megaterium]|uniref:lasso peptide biosynthesis PqqD family chaperone n=1 Tax=Priestia megaterium TaxID=1404 RepID=UPI000BFCE544|nr:lasso peptide biosynthesis PqqD family chaperone [Priestia megaterium]PGT76783.1 PqqD family protein [Priestia megaterium]